MKRLALAVMIGALTGSVLPGSAVAAPAASPARLDPRIRMIAYDADQVTRLTGYFGFQTMLEFAPDERIENVSIGDALGWQVTPNKKANLLFIKPIDQTATTNMTVVTDRRRYILELTVAQPQASQDDLAYVVRFTYPAAASAPAVAAAPVAPTPRNTAYAVRGPAALSPSRVFDDGASTYFAWPVEAELPAVFILGEDGTEGLANAAVRHGYLVVDRLASRFVLRSGKTSVSVVNTAMAAPSEIRQ